MLGGKLQESDPKAVRQFGKWVSAKIKSLKETAKAREDKYLAQEKEQYLAGFARDGVKTAKHQIFSPG